MAWTLDEVREIAENLDLYCRNMDFDELQNKGKEKYPEYSERLFNDLDDIENVLMNLGEM